MGTMPEVTQGGGGGLLKKKLHYILKEIFKIDYF